MLSTYDDIISERVRKIKRLRCKRCDHEWNYKGRDEYRASCPRCHTSVIVHSKKKKTKDFLNNAKGGE